MKKFTPTTYTDAQCTQGATPGVAENCDECKEGAKTVCSKYTPPSGNNNNGGNGTNTNNNGTTNGTIVFDFRKMFRGYF